MANHQSSNWVLAVSTDCTTDEIEQSENDTALNITKAVLDDEELSDWLSKGLSSNCNSSNSNGEVQTLKQGLGIIYLCSSHRSGIQCTQPTASLLENYFRAPVPIFTRRNQMGTLTALHYSAPGVDGKGHQGFLLKYPLEDVKDHTRPLPHYGIIYNRRHVNDTLVIFFNKHTNITTALIISEKRIFEEDIKEKWTNPTLLCLDFINNIVNKFWSRISDHQSSLANIEHFIKEGWKEAEIIALNRTISDSLRISTGLASLLDVMEQIKNFQEGIKASDDDPNPLSNVAQEMNNLITNIRAANLESQLLEKRASMLTQAHHQSMMEVDAKMSAAIAKASKEDSSAMKTISVLGMIFLPGTFIATIFAMPEVFNFNNTADAPMMKPAFMYYWAITIPLTVTVVLIWVVVVFLPWERWLVARRRESRN